MERLSRIQLERLALAVFGLFTGVQVTITPVLALVLCKWNGTYQLDYVEEFRSSWRWITNFHSKYIFLMLYQ